MMTASDRLIERIRGEFREMPGLSLTLPQACRLWQVDRPSCEAALAVLMDERFLHRSRAGAFLASRGSGAYYAA